MKSGLLRAHPIQFLLPEVESFVPILPATVWRLLFSLPIILRTLWNYCLEVIVIPPFVVGSDFSAPPTVAILSSRCSRSSHCYCYSATDV
ncbi:unnamed protein product [Urochloa decumbens]|uniref:Uncharacterized protein n=1 Tax=Urochloa decumbens TaxID=240449 RepID=A0ABC8YI97_9POAL